MFRWGENFREHWNRDVFQSKALFLASSDLHTSCFSAFKSNQTTNPTCFYKGKWASIEEYNKPIEYGTEISFSLISGAKVLWEKIAERWILPINTP